MKIAVIGAGVVGVCTAFELAHDGHQVSVFERNAAVGEEASFACAGHLSPSLSHPFAFATGPRRAWLPTPRFARGVRVGRGTTWRDLQWLLGRKPTPDAYASHVSAAYQLAAYSLEHLRALSGQWAMEYEQSQGQMLLFRSAAEGVAFEPMLQALNGLGAHAHVLTPAQARALEPALCADLDLHSAVHFPQDAIANCRQVTHLLKQHAVRLGVDFHFDQAVSQIQTAASGVQLQTAGNTAESFDHVVACTGAGTSLLPLPGLKQWPLTRMWSYALSAQIRENLHAPHSAVVDYHQQVSISRMGARIRISGSAELGGTPASRDATAVRRLYQSLQSHFPGAADYGRSMQIWKGCSVFTPDGLPLVGPTAAKGVWLNTAHGHNGWSMACGSARLVADLIQGRTPELDAAPVQPTRFQR